MITHTIHHHDLQMRLDRFLRQKMPLKPLSEIYRLIRQGLVRVNGKKVRENYRFADKDVLEVRVPAAEWALPDRQGGGLRADGDEIARLADTGFFKRNFHVLYEDSELLLCDKPGNLVVHPGTGHLKHDTLIDLARSYLMRKEDGGHSDEPQLVHRIDKDTSGVIMLAKNRHALRRVHESFRGRDVTKSYLAICHGFPDPAEGVIELNLSRTHERNDGTKMEVTDEGEFSRTRYKVIDKCRDVARLMVEIDTGRTHQIRVHMAHIRCPIVGDVRYGDPVQDARIFGIAGVVHRLYLHARMITFPDPRTGVPRTVRAPEPAEFGFLMDLRRS